MPDINLAQEGKGGNGRKKEKRPSFEYTDPNRPEKPKDERKAPGNIGMWLKSLFRRTPPGESNDERLPQAITPAGVSSEKRDEDVEDIFADVSVPARARMKAEEKIPPVKMQQPASKKLKQLPEKKEKLEKETREGLNAVNLLPEEFSTKIDFRGRGMVLGLSVAGAILLVALVYVGLVIYENSIVARTRAATETRQSIESEIATLSSEQEESIAFEERLKLIRSMLNQHVYWTKFFKLLETYTVADVTFSGSIRLSAPGKYTLAATGRDYQSVAQQLLAFQQAIDAGEFISSAEIFAASQQQDESGVTKTQFSVDLVLLPNVNTYTAEEYSAVAAENTPFAQPTTSPGNITGTQNQNGNVFLPLL